MWDEEGGHCMAWREMKKRSRGRAEGDNEGKQRGWSTLCSIALVSVYSHFLHISIPFSLSFYFLPLYYSVSLSLLLFPSLPPYQSLLLSSALPLLPLSLSLSLPLLNNCYKILIFSLFGVSSPQEEGYHFIAYKEYLCDHSSYKYHHSVHIFNYYILLKWFSFFLLLILYKFYERRSIYTHQYTHTCYICTHIHLTCKPNSIFVSSSSSPNVSTWFSIIDSTWSNIYAFTFNRRSTYSLF